VYAATSRLLSADEQWRCVRWPTRLPAGLRSPPRPRDDVAVIETVKGTLGDRVQILVDANQNTPRAIRSGPVAMQVAKRLDAGRVLPGAAVARRRGTGAWRWRCSSSARAHADLYDFREHPASAYDAIQPDAILAVTTVSPVSAGCRLAGRYGRANIPHGARLPTGLVATLHAMAAGQSSLCRVPHDPPVLTPETTQRVVRDSIVALDGCVALSTGRAWAELDEFLLVVEPVFP
jgi:L-alanine-DL-glutamate epimerase-like enolase superfamily enzyme